MLKYEVYTGLGNSFVILTKEAVTNFSSLAIKLCEKENVDGLIIVQPLPLTMHFYNRDGSIGTMCGNGIRCFIHYCYNNKIINHLENDVMTKAGRFHTQIINTNPFIVKVNMGKADFSNKLLQNKTDISPFLNQKVNYQQQEYYLNCVFIGTHHTVVFVDNFDNVNNELGYYLGHLPIFIDRTNVDFVQVIDRQTLKVLTYERGVGFTKACGTGACASFSVAHLYQRCDQKVKVLFVGGSLEISQDNLFNDIYMIGQSDFIKIDQINMT